MKQRAGIIITIYAIFLLLLMLQHPLFMLYYHAKFSTVGIHDWFNVILFCMAFLWICLSPAI